MRLRVGRLIDYIMKIAPYALMNEMKYIQYSNAKYLDSNKSL